MPYILCIETGTDICSVALARNRTLISLIESREGKQHAQNLGVYVEEILRENDLDAEELAAVAVGKGPGSYTGLRIGVSLAKGISYAAGIPLIAVSSLESLARVMLEDFEAGILDIETLEGATLCPMIDARRMEVYCQLFDSQVHPLSEVTAHIVTPESFAEARAEGPLVIFGNGAAKSKAVLTGPEVKLVEVTPSARGLVGAAFGHFETGAFEDTAYFEPFYLKNFVATTSTKKIF